MADRIAMIRIVSVIHRYTAIITAGSLLMYMLTGFAMTRYKAFPAGKDQVTTADHPISVPAGVTEDDLPEYIQKEFGLRGHRGKIQKNGNGIITILYTRPGTRQQAVLSPDKKNLRIISTKTSLRGTVVTFHRIKEYGGGPVYDFYVFMNDLTGIAMLVFSITGLYMGLINGKNILLKLAFLAAGLSYTLLVIFSFMLS